MPAVTRSKRKNKGDISLIKTKHPSKKKIMNHTNSLTSKSRNSLINRKKTNSLILSVSKEEIEKKNKQDTRNVSIYESLVCTCIMGVCSYPTIFLLRFFLLHL